MDDDLALEKIMLKILLDKGLISELEHRNALEALIRSDSRKKAKKIKE